MIFDDAYNKILNEYKVTTPWAPKITGDNVLVAPKQPTVSVGYIANNQNEQVTFPKNTFGKRNILKNKNGTKAKLRNNR